MYSECPHCRAIFAVTTVELDARQGLVRCGCCHRIFNASWNLVDTLPSEIEATRPSETSTVAADEGSADADAGLATHTDLDIAGDRASEALVALDVRESTADFGLQDAEPEDGAPAETPAKSRQQDAASTDLDATPDIGTASVLYPLAAPTEIDLAPDTDAALSDEVEDRSESTEATMHSFDAETRVDGDTESIEPIPIEEAATVIAQELRKSADIELELEDDSTPEERTDTLAPESDKFATEKSVQDQVTDKPVELPHHADDYGEKPHADAWVSADSVKDSMGAESDTSTSDSAVLEPLGTEVLDDDADDTSVEPDDEVDATATIVSSGDESAEATSPQEAPELTQDAAANDWEEAANTLAPTGPSHAEDLEGTADHDETQTELASSSLPISSGDLDVHIEDDGDDLNVVGLDTGSEPTQSEPEAEPALAYADEEAAEDQPPLTHPDGIAQQAGEDQPTSAHSNDADEDTATDQPVLAYGNDAAGEAISTDTPDSKPQEVGNHIDTDAIIVTPEEVSKQADPSEPSASVAAADDSTGQPVIYESVDLEVTPLHDDDAESIPEVKPAHRETASEALLEQESEPASTETEPEEFVERETRSAPDETVSEELIEQETKPALYEPGLEKIEERDAKPAAGDTDVEEPIDQLKLPATETAPGELADQDVKLPHTTEFEEPSVTPVQTSAGELAETEPTPQVELQDMPAELETVPTPEIELQDTLAELETVPTPEIELQDTLAELETVPTPEIELQDTLAELEAESTLQVEHEDALAELEAEPARQTEHQDAMVESRQDSPSPAGDEPEIDETTIPSAEDASTQDVAALQTELESSAAKTSDARAEPEVKNTATKTTDVYPARDLKNTVPQTTTIHPVTSLGTSTTETIDTPAVPDLESLAAEITDTHAEPDVDNSVTDTTNTDPVPDEEIVLESFEYDWSALEDSLSPAAKDKMSADALGIAPYVHSEARLVRNGAGRSAATSRAGKRTSAKAPRKRPATAKAGAETPVSKPFQATPSAEVLAGSPYGRLAIWSLGSTLLLALLVGQFGYFYWDELAQNPVTRTYLIRICEVMKCEVRARRAPALIDLAHTSVSSHPAVPGALRITANLVNRAEYAQPYPTLQVSLTDVDGRVIGRRSFQPTQYLSSDVPAVAELFPDAAIRVALDLTQPDDRAIGYEVELVSP